MANTDILNALVEINAVGLTAAPQIVSAAQLAISLIESGEPPSPQEQAQIDAALDAAHSALQNARPRAS
jgi:hypothetical protein